MGEKQNTEPILEWKVFWKQGTKRSKSVDQSDWSSKLSEKKEDLTGARRSRHSQSGTIAKKPNAKEEKEEDDEEDDQMSALVLEVNNVDLGTVNIQHGIV